MVMDTHRAIGELTSSNLTKDQAEAIVKVMQETALKDAVTRDYLDAKLEAHFWKSVVTIVGLNAAVFGLLLKLVG